MEFCHQKELKRNSKFLLSSYLMARENYKKEGWKLTMEFFILLKSYSIIYFLLFYLTSKTKKTTFMFTSKNENMILIYKKLNE